MRLRADMEMDAAVELLCAHLPRADLAALSDELGAPGTSEAAKQTAVQVCHYPESLIPGACRSRAHGVLLPCQAVMPIASPRLSVVNSLQCCAVFLRPPSTGCGPKLGEVSRVAVWPCGERQLPGMLGVCIIQCEPPALLGLSDR